MYFRASPPNLNVCFPRMYEMLSTHWYTFCAYPCGARASGPKLLPSSSTSAFGKFKKLPGTTRFGPFSREYDVRKSLITLFEMDQASVKMILRASELLVPRNCAWGCEGLKSGAR